MGKGKIKASKNVPSSFMPSLDYILDDEALMNALLEHAKPSSEDENIEFLLSITKLWRLQKETEVDRQLQIIYDKFIADDRCDVTMANVGSRLKMCMDRLFGPRADDEKTPSLSIEKKKALFTTDHQTCFYAVTNFIEQYNFYESELFKNALYDKKTKRFGRGVRYEMKSEYVEASMDRNNWSEKWLDLHDEDGYDSHSLAPSSSNSKDKKIRTKTAKSQQKSGDSKHRRFRK